MTDQWLPKNKPELMSAIEREWTLLMNAMEKLTDKQMTTPDEGGWSPKDNLAHLSEWMKLLMGYDWIIVRGVRFLVSLKARETSRKWMSSTLCFSSETETVQHRMFWMNCSKCTGK